MEDHEIIELYWARTEQAISETSQKYGNRLYSLAHHILRSEEDSEECVNDTYHAAWKTIPPKRPDHFFAYLAKITRNFSLDVLDKRKAQKRNALVVELSEELENCISSPDDCERRLEGREIGEAINGFLDTQPKAVRIVFVRRYWYFDSLKEISRNYGMSEGKIKSILFRTRNALRSYLEQEGITL